MQPLLHLSIKKMTRLLRSDRLTMVAGENEIFDSMGFSTEIPNVPVFIRSYVCRFLSLFVSNVKSLLKSWSAALARLMGWSVRSAEACKSRGKFPPLLRKYPAAARFQ
jgi:hypothetical protein